MASTNKTVTLELSQFIATDKPSWLTDYNGDMGKIDTFAAGVDADVSSAKSDAASAKSTAQTANTTAQQAQIAAGQAQTTANQANSSAQQAQETASQAQTTANEAITLANEVSKYYQYSTSERNTGNKWIDGKSIYEKVITGTLSSPATSVNYLKVGANVDTYVDIKGIVKTTNSWLPIGCGTNTDFKTGSFIQANPNSASTNKNTVGVGASTTSFDNLSVTVIIQYTKV